MKTQRVKDVKFLPYLYVGREFTSRFREGQPRYIGPELQGFKKYFVLSQLCL